MNVYILTHYDIICHMKKRNMARKIVVANWKMHPRTAIEAERLFGSMARSASSAKKTEIVICPPYLYLGKIQKLSAKSRKISLGAQDAYGRDVGAFTGEVSAEMLRDFGVKYVILGHSERRALGEINELVNKKIKDALYCGVLPILCVGETVRDSNHQYFHIVKTQLLECLNGISKQLISKIIIAYEPVWALSSTQNRKDATADDSREMAIYIRKILSDKFGKDAIKVRILYGGSVNERDAGEFLQNGGVDGVLAGKASLDPKKFTEIVRITESLK
jgi:triosephosphate isomerase (TIM)